jgi:hypothetical protein
VIKGIRFFKALQGRNHLDTALSRASIILRAFTLSWYIIASATLHITQKPAGFTLQAFFINHRHYPCLLLF